MKLVYLLLAILGTIASQTEQHAIPSQRDKGATRLQLAKTGDREALQYFACQSLTTLYTFNVSGPDGHHPYGGLIFDAAGNLYGTTFSGGISNDGTVFELTPAGGRVWTEKVLHHFRNNGKDGSFPYGGLVFETREGGTNRLGTVFEITP